MSYQLLKPRDFAIWADARPFLDVRNNDEHTLVAYGIAKALLSQIPDADESVVLPAILLHDVGWKQVPERFLLDAIGRHPTRKDLVRDHEVFGVEIAEKILHRLMPKGVNIESVLGIIDGHDTTHEARSLNDAVVKDADKAWRNTPHGHKTICNWYDCSTTEYLDTLEEVSNPRLLTDAGKALAQGLTASMRAELSLLEYLEGAADD